MDPYSFFADPDPGVYKNADPDPATLLMLIQIQLLKICNKLPYKETTKIAEKLKTMEELVQIYFNLFTAYWMRLRIRIKEGK